MKVRFDSTFEDFVDVNKRSVGKNVSTYVVLAVVMLALSGAVGGLVYIFSGSWLYTVIMTTVSLISGAIAIVRAQDQQIRTYLKKRLKVNAPVPTEVEINETGVLTRCMGQTLMQEWNVVENIEETDDAIYFRNKFGLYCSARKRGFKSEAEMKEFLDLAKAYWSRAAVPEPPTFKS